MAKISALASGEVTAVRVEQDHLDAAVTDRPFQLIEIVLFGKEKLNMGEARIRGALKALQRGPLVEHERDIRGKFHGSTLLRVGLAVPSMPLAQGRGR